MLVDGEPVHFRSGKAKELMALCVYRDGRPVSIHEIVENLWGENADGTGYRRTIKELADTLRDYGAEEMFLRSRGSLRVRMDLADSDFQAFMSGDEDAICQVHAAVFLGGAHGLHAAGEKGADACPHGEAPHVRRGLKLWMSY